MPMYGMRQYGCPSRSAIAQKIVCPSDNFSPPGNVGPNSIIVVVSGAKFKL